MNNSETGSLSVMIDCRMRPLWNPNIPLVYESTDRVTVYLPLQQNNVIKFRSIKTLSCYPAKFDASQMNSWGMFKYFDGSKNIREICEIIMKCHPEVTEKDVVEKIEKLYSKGLISFI